MAMCHSTGGGDDDGVHDWRGFGRVALAFVGAQITSMSRSPQKRRRNGVRPTHTGDRSCRRALFQVQHSPRFYSPRVASPPHPPRPRTHPPKPRSRSIRRSPAALGNLTTLHTFDAEQNTLTGAIPPSLGNLTNLTSLKLANNSLSGAIPPEIGNLPNLRYLDLGHNQLSGSLPAALGNLSDMLAVKLGHNAFTGPIPPALTQMAPVGIFELHQNQLSGQLALEVAAAFEQFGWCTLAPGNADLYVPDLPAYRAADANGDGTICLLPFASAEDIGEDAIDDIDDLVPGTLNEGQANALETKIENAIAKAANGQYAAAIRR